MDAELRAAAEAARGFMPAEEGLALYEAAAGLPPEVQGALLEVGAYCGKSAMYLGAAARTGARVLFSLDHHRGSEENQPGWEWHEPDLVDPHAGLIDTLPHFRRAIFDAGLESHVVAIVGESMTVARWWSAALALVFIDGGHGREPAHADYRAWAPRVAVGGRLAIHDVFPDPRDGGRPPYEIYCMALESGLFREIGVCGSLRVLERVGAEAGPR
ncbi:MAG: 1-O-methyltransferase [Acidimicrobiia bacterium]|jgi:predicted O-methyltransferase YrrM|nr:1-O-methyltransferase [Acidimicrobiia bacterium]